MRSVALALCLVLAPAARALTPIAEGSAHGVMMAQALHTLGAWVVSCAPLATHVDTTGGEVTCAQVPGSMYGFFREAIHGRLYEYLSRKTLAVVHDWSSAGGVLSVAYAVDGGTFTITRERVNGVIYAVFRFVATPPHVLRPVGRPGEAPGEPPGSTSAATTPAP
jgi:hypothetical protein